MLSYNLLDRGSQHMLLGSIASHDTMSASSMTPPFTPSPTKSEIASKRSRLIWYLGLPNNPSSPTHQTLSKLLGRTDSDDDIFDHEGTASTRSSSPTYCDSPATQLTLAMKLKNPVWRQGKRQKLAHDIPLWFQKIYRFRKAKKMYQLQGSPKVGEPGSNYSNDLDEMLIRYREYRFRSTPSLRADFESLDDAIQEDLNSQSLIPPFSPINTLSYDNLEELRKQIFSMEFLSDHMEDGELDFYNHPEFDPFSFDSVDSADQFELSPTAPTIVMAMNGSTTQPEQTLPKTKTGYRNTQPTVPEVFKGQEISVIKQDLRTQSSLGATTSSAGRSSSTSSTYSIVTIAIPTVRNEEFLTSLVESTSAGQLVEPIYLPESIGVGTLTLEKRVMDITDPQSFEDFSPEQIQLPMPSDQVRTRIKFEEFAQVMLYNNGHRLRRGSSVLKGSKKSTPKENMSPEERSVFFKQRCSLRLYESSTLTPSSGAEVIHLSRSCRLKISPIFDHSKRNNSTRSILKSKFNGNSIREAILAQECDEVSVYEFLSIVDETERKRQELLPYLQCTRRQQVDNYYEDPTRRDELDVDEV